MSLNTFNFQLELISDMLIRTGVLRANEFGSGQIQIHNNAYRCCRT
jgi:hypothetical protein